MAAAVTTKLELYNALGGAPVVNVIVCATCIPLPDSCTNCVLDGFFSALSMRVSEPGKVPLCIGVKATAIKHWPPEGKFVLELQSVPPEIPCRKFALTVTLDIVNCWFPLLETVSVWGALVEPTFVAGKVRAACVRFTSYTLPTSVT